MCSKRGTADVTEFASTIHFTSGVFDKYLNTKANERPSILEEGVYIESILREYEDFLINLVNTGKFLRFFTSNRVKQRLDKLNTKLYKEAIILSLELKNKKPKKPEKKSKKVKEQIGDPTEILRGATHAQFTIC